MTGSTAGAAPGGAPGSGGPLRSLCHSTVGDGSSRIRGCATISQVPVAVVPRYTVEAATTRAINNSMLSAFDRVLQQTSSPDYVNAVLGSHDETFKKLDNGVGTTTALGGPVGVGYTEDVIYTEAVVESDVAVGIGYLGAVLEKDVAVGIGYIGTEVVVDVADGKDSGGVQYSVLVDAD